MKNFFDVGYLYIAIGKKCSSGLVFHGTKPGSRSPAGLSFGLAQVSEVYPIARCASDTPKKTARPSARL